MSRLAKLIVAGGRGQAEPPKLPKGKTGHGRFLTRHDGKRVGKLCSGCGTVKHYDEFGNNSKVSDGKRSICKECDKEQIRIRRQSKEYQEKEKEQQKEYFSRPENKEHKREYNREYYSHPENKKRKQEYDREYSREYYENNPEQFVLNNARKRARKQALPHDMTDVQAEAIDARFTRCPLTGSQDTEEEHFQAISWGQGEGHSVRNVWHLDGYLNRSKHASNPFEFFRRGEVIKYIEDVHGVPHTEVIRRIESLFAYFADMNDMTVEDFEAYTSYCYEHQKTDDEIDAYNAAGQTVDSRHEFETYSA